MQSLNMPYQELANAVVVQAVQDYRDALDGISYTRKKTPEQIVEELEKFFRSEYYRTLTNVDGENLIAELKREHEEKLKEKRKKELLCESH